MRKAMCLVVAIGTIGSTASFAGGPGFGVRSGGLASLAGTYNESTSTAELLQPGSIAGVFLQQQVARHYGIEAGVDLGWAPFADAYREEPGKKPMFVVPAVTFCNRVSLPMGPLAPYAVAGVGVFPWRFTRDGLRGDPVTVEGEALKKMSAGLVGGVGLELRFSRWAAVFGEARVAYVLSRDRFLFGSGFSEQTLLSIGGGVSVFPWGR
ncbi:MAG: hypothetical protein ONB30_06270 [candidate division KSB1 bacterium]|nr:hypothetical protein [candidate division KSB1 bacterium]